MSTTPLLDLTRAKEFAFEADQLRELVITFEQSLAQAIAALYQTIREKPLDMTGPSFTALVPHLTVLLGEVRACRSAL